MLRGSSSSAQGSSFSRMCGKAVALLVLSLLPLAFGQNAGLPASVAVHAKAANEAESRNDFAKAVEEYSVVVKAMPSSAQMQSNLGVAFYFAGDKQRALTVLDRAMQIDPNLFVPHL